MTRDYRAFLKELLANRGMNQAQFAAKVGRSRSWVSQMMSGGRALKPGIARQVADLLDLDQRDRMKLLALVELVEGESELARAQAMSVIGSIDADVPEGNLEEEAMLVLSQWYVGAILELSRCERFRTDPRWIAATLSPRISTEKAAEALTALVRLGMLTPEFRHAGDETHFSTKRLVPSGGMSSAAARFHRQTTTLAANSIHEFAGNERMIAGASVALSEEGASLLRKRV
ncbi:MAG: TIGR02147 family protein [Myxococcota bacterium]